MLYNTNNILNGELSLGGDKSISHRLLIVAALLKGESVVKNISLCDDVQSTIECLRKCNVDININNDIARVSGGLLKNPENYLNCRNSGTTARLLIGLFVGQDIKATLIGDRSLNKRPMRRIINPLIEAGADIISKEKTLPITIVSGIKKSFIYKNKTKSAQVKSALMLSSLESDNITHISYNLSTRNHLEKILEYLNFDITINSNINIKKTCQNKNNFKLFVPGDISNASFLIASALITPYSEIKIKNILYNKTRCGFIKVLLKMGANLKIENIRSKKYEEVCDIIVKYTSDLKGIYIKGDEIIEVIDEIPALSIVATQVNGEVQIMDAAELRLKESDRIHAICKNLVNFGADVIENSDGFAIKGGSKLYSASINHFNDHRIAMAFEILQLLVTGKMTYGFNECIKVSFPEFYSSIDKLLS